MPLSDEAVGILVAARDRLKPEGRDDWKRDATARVFASPSGGLLSDVAINKSLALAVRDAGITGHFTAQALLDPRSAIG